MQNARDRRVQWSAKNCLHFVNGIHEDTVRLTVFCVFRVSFDFSIQNAFSPGGRFVRRMINIHMALRLCLIRICGSRMNEMLCAGKFHDFVGTFNWKNNSTNNYDSIKLKIGADKNHRTAANRSKWMIMANGTGIYRGIEWCRLATSNSSNYPISVVCEPSRVCVCVCVWPIESNCSRNAPHYSRRWLLTSVGAHMKW